MKTTLEIPDDLYREVKAAAALRKVPVKDMVAMGLRKVLQDQQHDEQSIVLNALQELRESSTLSPSQVREKTEEAYRTRKEGWGPDDN